MARNDPPVLIDFVDKVAVEVGESRTVQLQAYDSSEVDQIDVNLGEATSFATVDIENHAMVTI